MKNVAVISLGCDKNRVDTEHMLYGISRGGYAISDLSDAEVIIINTCAFIESARQESIDNILQCAELKKTGKCRKLIVTGCLPQKYRGELERELPEVDAFLGAFEYDKITSVIEDIDETAASGTCDMDFCEAENAGRLLSTYPHLAYLKIAEGCDNRCTFCTIPSIRGKYRSRPVSDIVSEAASLVRDGVKEIVLVAQDVTRYGDDLNDGSDIVSLLSELEKTDVQVIRLLYCYPERVTDGLIDKISSSEKIANYIDIPIQHGSDKILKLMNRKAKKADMVELFGKLHERGITVRTTLMVGFPGETEQEFEELCDFVKEVRPEYAGIFAYSKEDGTAAARLKGHNTKAVKRKRIETLGQICTDITHAFNESLIGQTVEVLYEDIDFDKNMFAGRAKFMAPDVDGRVYFTAREVNVGDFYNVKITACDDYDLYGEVTDDSCE